MLNQHDIGEPSVVFYDRGRALMRGLEAVFPQIPHLLCLWHINEDVKANINATFGMQMQRGPEGRWGMSPQGEAFFEMYKSCIRATTVEAFDIAWNELKGKNPGDLARDAPPARLPPRLPAKRLPQDLLPPESPRLLSSVAKNGAIPRYPVVAAQGALCDCVGRQYSTLQHFNNNC